MVCAEPHRPYDRPPLSKEVLLDDAAAEERLSFRPGAWYERAGRRAAPRRAGRRPRRSAARSRSATAARLAYDDLLIATGGTPADASRAFDGFENVSTLRTLEDSRLLRAAPAPGRSRCWSSARASSARRSPRRHARPAPHATIVEAAPAPAGSRCSATSSGGWFAELHRASGVELLLGEQVARDPRRGAVESVTLDAAGASLPATTCSSASASHRTSTGSPAAGFDRSRGAHRHRRANRVPGVYAAGDAAALLDPVLGRHVPGQPLGERRDARAPAPPRRCSALDPGPAGVSSFWSDLYGTRIQYLGHAPLADARQLSTATPPPATSSRTFTSERARPSPSLLAGRPQMLPQRAGAAHHHNERKHDMTLRRPDRRERLLRPRRLRGDRTRDLPPRRRRGRDRRRARRADARGRRGVPARSRSRITDRDTGEQVYP